MDKEEKEKEKKDQEKGKHINEMTTEELMERKKITALEKEELGDDF